MTTPDWLPSLAEKLQREGLEGEVPAAMVTMSPLFEVDNETRANHPNIHSDAMFPPRAFYALVDLVREAAGRHLVDGKPEEVYEPINEAFRAGSLTLGWDGDAERVLLEARAESEDGEPIDPDEDDDDDEDGPDLLRVMMTPETARSFVARAARVVAAGRPPCPLCGAPLDPQGHICPRRNGHYVN